MNSVMKKIQYNNVPIENSYGKYLIELSKTDLNKDPVRVLSRRNN